MLRRTCASRFMEHASMNLPSNTDGPTPEGAPIQLNANTTKPWYDKVENSFPTSLRGRGGHEPDVPDHHWIPQFFHAFSSISRASVTPWSAEGPENAFRFRPFPQFDKRAQDQIRQMHEAPEPYGPNSLPYRDRFLAELEACKNPYINRRVREKAHMTPCTYLDREIARQIHKKEHQTPLQVQRDAGRIERPLPIAGKLPVDPLFPYVYDVDDLREYERTKHHLKRFTWQPDAEAQYTIIICAHWDHQARLCAEDFATFICSIAKTTIEEKLQGLRSQIAIFMKHADVLDSDGAGSRMKGVDPKILEAIINELRAEGNYSTKEIRQFVLMYLETLERQCQLALSRVNSGEFPEVKELEPFIRAEQFWASKKPFGNFNDMESSTRCFEWRRYFRQITLRLPFTCTEIEKRIKDTRLWLHRECTVEYQTMIKRNIVLDFEKFPVMHDPNPIPGHEYHRNFSFALDWKPMQPYGIRHFQYSKKAGCRVAKQEKTAHYEDVFPTDTWATMASRMDVPLEDLKDANADVRDKVDKHLKTSGEADVLLRQFASALVIPKTAKQRRPAEHPWLLSQKYVQSYLFPRTIAEEKKFQPKDVYPVPEEKDGKNSFPFEMRRPTDTNFPRAGELVPGEQSWWEYTKCYLDKKISAAGPAVAYRHNPHWPVQHPPGTEKDTPYEEDQTWMLQQQPFLRNERFPAESWFYDLPRVNREPLIRSMDWQAP